MNDMEYLKGKSTGERIKAARKSAGLSQAELSDKIGVTQPTVAQWEKGGYIPQYANIIAISKVTGIPYQFLCDDETKALFSKKDSLFTDSNDAGISDIFRALGIDPDKVPKKPTVDESMLEAARELHKLKLMFLEAGFSDTEAFTLTEIVFRRSCE